MKYDFTTVMERRGMDAIAVDSVGMRSGFGPGAPKEGFDVIPMWVADMNFPACPTIPAAMIRRAQHPAYGYFEPRAEYYEKIIRWQQTRNHVTDLRPEHIGYENGVLGGVVSAVNVLCSRGDNILVHSPTYIGFTKALTNNGYHLVHSPMFQDGDNIWRMDFADMEKKIVENRIHTAIFCSPHNPTGRVWEKWEVAQAMALFEKHNVYVISDEIWSDIIDPAHRHIPTQSVSPWAREHVVAQYAPSKTFNLAGLVGAYHIIYNDWLRERIEKESSLAHYNEMNLMSMYALLGAYAPEGYEWCDELNQVIHENLTFACGYIQEHFEGVTFSRPQGTYMLFVDCAGWLEKRGRTMDELEKACWDVGVAVQDGRMFHGMTHLRMNLALPMSRVREAFRRLDQYVFNA